MLGTALITIIGTPFGSLNHTTIAMAYLLVVLFISIGWGVGPGRVAAVLSALCFNFFFLPPILTFVISDPQNWVAFGAFFVTASVVGHLSARFAKREHEAAGEASRWISFQEGPGAGTGAVDARMAAMLSVGVRFTSLFACAVGILGLTGWAFGIEIFKSVIPGQVVIKPNAALCLASLGLSLWLQRNPERQTGAGVRLGARLLAGFVLVIGLLSLMEFIFHWDIGIDQLLFRETARTFASVRPGLMAPITALCFILLALALLFLDWIPISLGPRLWPAELFALSAGIVSIVGLLDFLLESPTSFTFIALQTAVTVALLAGGIVCSRTDRGLAALLTSSGMGGFVTRQLLPAAIIVPLLVGMARWRAASLGLLRSEWGGVTMMTVAMILLLLGLTVWTGYAIERSDAERRKAEQATSELADIVQAAEDAVIRKTLDGRILTWNRAAERIFGYTAQEMVGHDVNVLVPPEKLEELEQIMARVRRGESTEHYETVRVRKDGRSINVSVSISPIRDANGAIVAAATLSHDITERKRARNELLRINRAHRALSSCNLTLIRAEDELSFLEQVCRIIVDEAGFRFCWVGFAEPEKPKAVRPLAWAGFEDGYLKTLNLTWADSERGRGPTGTCIRTGETQITKSTADDPRMGPWRMDALKRGYASSIAIPIVVDSKRFGALTIYSSETEGFGGEEVKLLSELAADMGYGIAVLRTRAARVQALEEIRALNSALEERVNVRTAELQHANRELEQAHEREGEIALRIQRTLLLDQPPKDMPPLRVAALTVPSERVGGDFYVFLRHSAECLDVIVGDVMGKGIQGALLGAATKGCILRALSDLVVQSKAGKIPEPKEIVSLAHAEIVGSLIELSSFVTLFYARLDAKRKSLTYVDCGHTGVLKRHGETGLCEVLHGDNLPLGFKEGEIYDQSTVPLIPGDTLLFFSDGITEARNGAEELFGVERLQESVKLNGDLEPDALIESVRNAVFDFTKSEQLADDLTAVAIRATEFLSPLLRREMDIDSDLRALPKVREFVRTFCGNLPGKPLDGDSTAQLVLATNEAGSNIIKHAYHGRKDQRVHIEAEAFPGTLSIRLHHVGDPIDLAKVPPASLDGSRDSGFGVYIISKSVDAARYYRDARGRNCVDLVKTWKQ